jgi:hypothetical protein
LVISTREENGKKKIGGHTQTKIKKKLTKKMLLKKKSKKQKEKMKPLLISNSKSKDFPAWIKNITLC